MLIGQVILEDSVLAFRYVVESSADDGRDFELTIGDNMSGKTQTTRVTNEELGAIIGTAICGTNDEIMTAAASLVNRALAGFPRELQPSPCYEG